MLEEEIKNLTAAIHTLTMILTRHPELIPTPQAMPEVPAGKPEPKAEPKAEKVAAPVTASAPAPVPEVLKYADVQAACVAAAARAGQEAAVNTMRNVTGCQSLTGVKAEQYAALVEAMNVLGA